MKIIEKIKLDFSRDLIYFVADRSAIGSHMPLLHAISFGAHESDRALIIILFSLFSSLLNKLISLVNLSCKPLTCVRIIKVGKLRAKKNHQSTNIGKHKHDDPLRARERLKANTQQIYSRYPAAATAATTTKALFFVCVG